LITILIIIINKFMGIFSGKTADQKIKNEFNKEKKDFIDGKEGDNSFLSIPISSSQEQDSNWVSFGQKSDSNNNFLYFNNSLDQNSSSTEISPAMYDLVYKLELAVKSGKIDNDAIELFNQTTRLCSIEQITKISPVITAPTLQIFVEKSKELGKEVGVVENNIDKNLDKNLSPNNLDKPNNDLSDFRDFIRERQNPFEAQKELMSQASLENDVDKKI